MFWICVCFLFIVLVVSAALFMNYTNITCKTIRLRNFLLAVIYFAIYRAIPSWASRIGSSFYGHSLPSDFSIIHFTY